MGGGRDHFSWGLFLRCDQQYIIFHLALLTAVHRSGPISHPKEAGRYRSEGAMRGTTQRTDQRG